MTADRKENYYQENLPKLMAQYDALEKALATALSPVFEESKITALLKAVRSGIEALLPGLPYIGGEASVMTQFLVNSAYSLPLFFELEKEGISLRDMAKILYQANESVFLLMPSEKREQLGEFYFSDKMIGILKKDSETSQKRQYPEDWVFEFVDGDGQACDYGYDLTECGIMKFYKSHNAERFAPILCLLDYASYRALGVGFTRTRKLATGDARCDFRFKKDCITPRGWPPDPLEERFPF